MGDNGSASAQFRLNVRHHPGLLVTGEWKNHSPVAALEITTPGSAACGLQKFLVVAAERAQVRIAGDNDPPLRRQWFSQAGAHHILNQTAVSSRLGPGQVRPEDGIFEELASRT